MQERKPFSHIKVFFKTPDGREREAGIILMGEFGSGFIYHNDYDGPPLDPVHLDYRRTSRRRFRLEDQRGRLHGVFEDCLPNGFAHRMLCHDEPGYADKSDVERMFWLGSRTHGPLRFESMSDIGNQSPIRGEKKLEEVRKRVVAFHLNEAAFDGEKVMNPYNRFALTYDGGAHPKCLYEHVAISAGQGGIRRHERSRWVAKFNVESQVTNRARVEGTMLDLSAACGINTPEVRIKTLASNEDVLMVRRFDQVDTDDGFQPLHKLSMCSLIGLDNMGRSRAGRGDFADVLAAVKEVSANPAEDTEELFRRMLFHVAINNADNHLKNFEMLLTERGWRLAPSFDTLPSDGPKGTEPFATTVCGEAFPELSQEFVFAQGRNFGLPRHRAAEIARQVFEACAQVDSHMTRFKVSQADRDRIHAAMPLEIIKELSLKFRRLSEHEAANALMIDEPARVVGAP